MNDRCASVLDRVITNRIAVSIALVLCCGGVPHAADLAVHRLPKAVQQQTRMLNADYLTAVPVVAKQDTNVPLLIFLHGAGGRGRDIERVKPIARPAFLGMENFAGEPCIFVAPQATEGTKEIPASWLPDDLDRFLTHLKTALPVDADRVYVTGNSMGGYGTWAWAAHSPHQFAAAAPVVGGLGKGGPKDITPDLDRWAENLTTLPVWAFHGANDKVVPADRSERMIKLIRDKGGKLARLTVFPDEGHGASRQVYTSRDFFEWLFAQNAAGRGEADAVPADQQDRQEAARTTETETQPRVDQTEGAGNARRRWSSREARKTSSTKNSGDDWESTTITGSRLPKSAAGSSILSRDMLKMGLLVPNNGKWNGKQLIPAEFVKQATSPIIRNVILRLLLVDSGL